MTLDPRIKEHLKYFGFDAIDEASVADLTLNPAMKLFLWENGFNPSSLNKIENYKPLVAGLNRMQEDIDAGKRQMTFKDDNGISSYNHESKILNLDPGIFPILREGEDATSIDQWEAVLKLAHELTHAYQSSPIDVLRNPDKSMTDFVNTYLRCEGEALYYQFQTLRLIYPEKSEFELTRWLDNRKAPSEGEENKLYNTILGIIDNNSLTTTDEKIVALAEEHRTISAGESLGPGVSVTYDEYVKLQWLIERTDLIFDYLDAVKPNYEEPIAYERNWRGRRGAFNTHIRNNPDFLADFKVLVNKYHKTVTGNDYFGVNDNTEEILRAETNGSEVSKLNGRDEDGNRREVLWGGEGVDNLYGSSINDLLLGGVGNDHLHGGSGLNYLYGGAGKDTYYIGEGIDVISDHDRDSVIMWNGKKLDKIYRVSGNLYADFNGLSYYNYGSRMLVFQPGGGLIAALEGFDFLMQRSAGGSNYGLTVVDDNPINDIPKTVLPGTNPGLGGDVYHTINSSASQKGQYVGIIAGSKDDLFTGGYGNEVVDMGAGNDIANGGLGHDVIDGGSGSQYSWAA